jgi:DNA replication licensing factor MCM5
MSLREINSGTIHQLIVVNGIIISATKSSIKMNKCTVQCKNCGNLKTIEVKSGFSNISIPRQCDSAKLPTENKEKCPLDSYHIVPEKSTYIDSQILKIQEPPETIPVGEIPRSYLIYCDRNLVNKVTPGTRVTVIGIQCVDERNLNRNSTSDKNSYIKVLNFQTEEQKSGRQRITFTQEDELKFQQLAKDKKIYEKISRSIAPAIYGMEDIKKSIACLLFGGCRKRMNEGVNLRGDINILLLGDPSTAKSQFLKFVERVAPVAVYTSGKGSSAAGLTASIIKDPSSGEFQLEGGAMVLADGGIVCIDEFDKMRAQDRVAIHEAMEQQTISVAKAGITTTLNSRTSVLAAANPIYGHIDELKSTQEQIDFQTTILSRFDCIFLVKDEHNEDKDIKLASHIVDISAAGKSNEQTEEGEIPIEELKKFIAYARMKVVPKLTEESGEFLKNYYVKDRKDYFEKKNKKGNDIPVTVRQLEAIIRLSEAIAKMSLSSTVTKNNVIEAHRLFQVSTLSAAGSNKIYRIPSEENAKEMLRIEEAIKRRLGIGQRIQTQRIIEELLSKFNSQNLIQNAIINLINNGSLKYHNEKKILTRKK